MYLCDCHTHTLISQDSTAPLAGMVKAAEALGLREYCVTDHCDLLDGSGLPVTQFDWAGAKAQFDSVGRELSGSMELRLGLELGSPLYDPAVARRIIAEGGKELDFVLGSFHNWMGSMDNIEFFSTDYTGKPELGRKSFEQCLENSWELVTQYPDCYDSLAHINYPIRYIRRDGGELSVEDYEEPIRAIFTQLARTDHALEVNTCRGKDLADWPLLLRWYRECGGRLVTVGSDAHRPQDVALGIPRALEMIREAGFDHIAVFVRRKPVEHKI